MNIPMKGLGVLAAAGLVAVAGHSAFTDSNTVPNNIAGYGTSTATGVTVTAVHYTPYAFDNSKVSQIVFNTSTNLSGQATNGVNGRVALYSGESATTAVGNYTCTVTTVADAVVTCDLSGSDGHTPVAGSAYPTFASFDHTALTVYS